MTDTVSLHPEVNAIIDFLYHRFNAKIYADEVPSNFKAPAYYIPPMSTFGGSGTVSTYEKSYTLNLKLFHESQRMAVNAAELLHDQCERERMLMPMYDQNGEPTNDYVRLKRIDVRAGDGASAVMVFTWTSSYFYRKADYINITDFTLEGGLKGE